MCLSDVMNVEIIKQITYCEINVSTFLQEYALIFMYSVYTITIFF